MRFIWLFVVILSFTFGLSESTLAAATVSGELHLKYDSFSETNIIDGKIFVKSKVDPLTDLNLTIRYYNDAKIVQKDPSNPTSEYDTDPVKNEGLTVDTFYVVLRTQPDIGTFSVGMFPYVTGKVNILSNGISDLKSRLGLRYEKNITKTFYTKLIYLNEELTIGKGESCEAVVLGYDNKTFGAETHFINIEEPDNISWDYKIANTSNIYYKPNRQLMAYIHYADDEKDDLEKIVGAFYNPVNVPFVFNIEYNFDQDGKDPNGVLAPDARNNYFGFRIVYLMRPNVRLYYTRAIQSAIQSNELSELRLTTIF